MDIRIFKYKNEITPTIEGNLKTFAYPIHTSVSLDEAALLDVTASPLEALAGKVVKFLLTAQGSDAFDPAYGSMYIQYTLISHFIFKLLKADLSEDVSRCASYIKKQEVTSGFIGLKLQNIIILNVTYNDLFRDRVDIYLKIQSIDAQTAILKIPVTLNS